MEKLNRFKSLPVGFITIFIIIGAFYSNYMINHYYYSLTDSSFLEIIFRYLSPKSNIGMSVISLAFISIFISFYLTSIEQNKNPFLIEKKLLAFFDKIRIFETGRKMHYFLTALRVIFLTIAIIFYVILTTITVGLGTGLSPTLEMVNPDFYLPVFRYALIIYAFFELGNTFLVKTKHSVSVLFLLNLFCIPMLASFIFGFSISEIDNINNSNIELQLIDFFKIIALAVFINVGYSLLHKKYGDKKEKLSILFDSLLPLSTTYLLYPLVFTLSTFSVNLNFDPHQETTLNGEVIQYKENVLTMKNTTMFEEDVLEQSIGYPFKLGTMISKALTFARNNDLDDDFLDAIINTYIQQNEIYKENRTQILDTKLSENYQSDLFKIKMLKIRVATSDLKQETLFLQLLKDKKYQEAWDMYQVNLIDAKKRKHNGSNEINSSIKGYRIGAEHSIEDIFIHLNSKGLINLNLKNFDKDTQKFLNSSIASYERNLKESKDVEIYSGDFNLSPMTVDVIKNIINRHG